MELTKARWYSGICGKIHNMKMNPCLAWENICILTGGETDHHKMTINMAMKMEDATLGSNTKENMSVFGMHFHKVLNNHRPVDTTVLDLIQQKPCLNAINMPITFREVKAAINKLKKGKSPGLNGIPPEALKAMNDTPRGIVHKHVSDFFKGKVDHKGWHKSQCIPVPKKRDLSDPNKWQGIMLMDMSAKSLARSSTLVLSFSLKTRHQISVQWNTRHRMQRWTIHSKRGLSMHAKTMISHPM
jgi:hypothetical protein